MSKNLVIVESPAKAKTIKKYLGTDFEVLASYGHVRDLKPKKGSVDPAANFAMKYELTEKNKKHVDAIASALKKADALYLATDPDREGEAISWHILEVMNEKKLIKQKPVHRVAFYEITQKAVQEAVANPRKISMDMVNSQQARRALDYLVGFNLSPLLWKKVRRGLSAGRVQSPALRLIVEREEAIEAFISQEYWSITGNLTKKQAFTARLTYYEGKKLEQFSFTDEKTTKAAEKHLFTIANGKLNVIKVDKKQRKRQPAPPFTTSTLQQEAARKLGFATRKTMMIAQQLYEGVDIGSGTVGLITYMRTDSLNLGQEAIQNIRDYIEKEFGADNVPASPRMYKTKSKNAQEAHEAVRPTLVFQTPNIIKHHLTPDQFKLYTLIWKRAVACQMEHALIDTVAVDLSCGNESNLFRANGSVIAKPGFMTVYLEGKDDSANDDDDENRLPELNVGDSIPLNSIVSEQHFTEPPPRFSEASLVKTLEEFDIGRPSTYASIIQTLQQRGYALLENKRFIPTDVGRVVNRFLTKHFTRYVDYKFTANLEDELDAVSRGEKEWIPLMEAFWKPFIEQIGTIDTTVQRDDVTSEKTDQVCPKCGKPVVIRLGKRGRFIACTGYPECDYTANVSGEELPPVAEPIEITDRVCPKCSSTLFLREGKYGKFIGCSQYPKCKFIESAEKTEDTGIKCPQCMQANLTQKKSRRYGKIFYGCSRYPDCTYAIWNPPINEPCPKCDWPFLTLKETKRWGKEKVCAQKECGYKEKIEDELDSL
jgi:DNA topoisomerase I